MKRVLTLLLVLAMTLMAISVVTAQVPGPGEGGTLVWGNQRGSANLGPLVPIRCSGVDCADANSLMYPGFLGLEPSTLSFAPAGTGNVSPTVLATGWTPSEDGLTYTFTLKEGLIWNDGTPITAHDIVFTYNAIMNGDQIGLSASYGPARSSITNVVALDDYTLEVTFAAANCLALNRAALLPPLPGHAYGWTPETNDTFDWASMNGHPFDKAPTVTAGPFNFASAEPGTGVFLTYNPTYTYNELGYVPLGGVAYIDVPDYNVMLERLLAGQPDDVNFIFEPPGSILATAAANKDKVQVFQAPGTVWHYVAVNLADPTNPQNGRDENGNLIDQGHHPILGDKRVRQALQYAVDIDTILQAAQNGNATPMVSSTIPSAFSIHPTLQRRPYDLDAARKLLDEAGFTSTGDPIVAGGDGLRTCTSCLYAEPGTPMILDIMAVDQPRINAATVLQDSFAQIGIKLEVRQLDFNTMYDGNMGAQTFDLAVAGWRGGVPFNADQRSFFGVEQDIAGGGSSEYGFNFGSFYNAEFEELSEYIFSGAVKDGCDIEKIKEAAYKVQELLWEEQPYLFLYAIDAGYIASNAIVGFNPFPAQALWNVHSWYVKQ